METKLFYYNGNYVKIEGAEINGSGTLTTLTEAEASSLCATNPFYTLIVFFREANEPEPTFFRRHSARVKIVNLNDTDTDTIRPLLDRELQNCSDQVLSWLISCGSVSQYVHANRYD
jgi:hypothetical protein